MCCCPAPHDDATCPWDSRWRRWSGAPAHAFAWHADDAEDRRLRRILRGVRYAAPLRADAAAIVARVSRNGTRPFAGLHVRRGDFEHALRDWDGAAYAAAAGLASADGEAVYVATDEPRPREFFRTLGADRPLYVWDDVRAVAKGVSDAAAGPVEQLVLAEASSFVGSRASTFTNFIARLRGYRGRESSVFAPAGGRAVTRRRLRDGVARGLERKAGRGGAAAAARIVRRDGSRRRRG